jgi:hypothetical protein
MAMLSLYRVYACTFPWLGVVGELCFSRIKWSQYLKCLQVRTYTKMRFINCICNGNCRAAVVGYWQRPPTSQKFSFAKYVGPYTIHKGDCFLPANEFGMWTVMEWIRWCSDSTASKPKCMYRQNFQDDCCSKRTCMENVVAWRFLSVSPAKYTTLDCEITPTVQDFVIGCNDGYKFCLITSSRVTLILPGKAPETQQIRILGYKRIQVIFKANFSQRVL